MTLPSGDISVPSETTNAWGAFAFVDLVLAFSALLTLGLAFAEARELPLQLRVPQGWRSPPWGASPCW